MKKKYVLVLSCAIALTEGHAIAHDGVQHATYNSTLPRTSDGSESQNRRGQPMEVTDLPAPFVSIQVDGSHRVITTNTLPNHKIGEFPNPSNPNALRSLDREFRIPLNPQRADQSTPSRPEFGVGLNGVIFDSGTGEFWTASGERGRSVWNYDAGSANNQGRFGVDFNHGHVQPTGKYHYHGVPTALIESLSAEHAHDGHVHEMIQIGWAFDGFPVYAPYGYADQNDSDSDIVSLSSSYRLKSGERPENPIGPGGVYDGTYTADFEYVEGLGDLDESNGRTGVTPEFPEGTYYYVITDEFPSIPRTWVGTPDSSLQRGGPGDRPEGGPGGSRPPRPRGDAGSAQSDSEVASTVRKTNQLVNPTYFIEEALVEPIVTEMRTLSDGTEALCYVIKTYSEPHEHDMGPWAPAHIDDDAESGGIWFHEDEVLDVDGAFVLGAAELYNDPEWKLYRDDGSVRVTDTEEAFFAAARPDVDPQYKNYVVEGNPAWIERKVFEYVIPVQPTYQEEPTLIGGQGRGGEDRGGRGDRAGRPPRDGSEPSDAHSHTDGEGGHQHAGPAQTIVGVALNGVNFDPPAPVDAILSAYTIAPFDDAGGHINPYNGYHYHAVTGHTKEIKQLDGHAPLIGYIMDGFGLYALRNEDGTTPADLDECSGHYDEVRGYHYHAGAAADNQIIKAFRGIPGTMSSDK